METERDIAEQRDVTSVGGKWICQNTHPWLTLFHCSTSHIKFTSLMSSGLIYNGGIVIWAGIQNSCPNFYPFQCCQPAISSLFMNTLSCESVEVSWENKEILYLVCVHSGLVMRMREWSCLHGSQKNWFCYFLGKVLAQKGIHKLPSCPLRQLVQSHVNAFEEVAKGVEKEGKPGHVKDAFDLQYINFLTVVVLIIL